MKSGEVAVGKGSYGERSLSLLQFRLAREAVSVSHLHHTRSLRPSRPWDGTVPSPKGRFTKNTCVAPPSVSKSPGSPGLLGLGTALPPPISRCTGGAPQPGDGAASLLFVHLGRLPTRLLFLAGSTTTPSPLTFPRLGRGGGIALPRRAPYKLNPRVRTWRKRPRGPAAQSPGPASSLAPRSARAGGSRGSLSLAGIWSGAAGSGSRARKPRPPAPGGARFAVAGSAP